MPVEPAFNEATPMMIDAPVRHADSDEESNDEAPPSIVDAAMENLIVLFRDLHLNNGPRYFGEDFDVEVLCASFSRLSIAETPTHDVYPRNILIFDAPPSSVGFFTPYHVATVSNIVEVMVIGADTSTTQGKASTDAADPAAVAADTLQAALIGLKTPIAASTNPNDARASLEEAHRQILEEGIAIASAKRRMEATQREYNSAYGLTPVSEAPSRLGSVHGRGRFIAEILGRKQPVYETPAVNLRGHRRPWQKCQVWRARSAPSRRSGSRISLTPPTSSRHGLTPVKPNQSLRDPTPEHVATLAVISTQRDLPRIALSAGRGDQDARMHLNAMAESALLEEYDPIGPACFGPRIRGEPFPRGFTFPRDTPKYNGTAKPEDWLIDYTTAVGIAGGNKRVAVRYVPLMLAGSAQTWLNSLPAGSVNSWVDFEEAFVRNFTGTYNHPGRPRELAMCVQRPDEPLRDYVTRWTELRNSREGVHEVQATKYFINGCRDGTLLKHKLMCSEPTSLAVLMAKADKYATADSAMRVKVTASDKAAPTPATPKAAGDNRGGQNNNKRKADQLDSRSNNKLVIDLALKLVNPIVKPREVFPNINGIHLVIASEILDHRVVGVESTLNHPLALEDLLLHCFEPRLHASDLLRPLNITDVQHPLAHLDRLRVFQHFCERCVVSLQPRLNFSFDDPMADSRHVRAERWEVRASWAVPEGRGSRLHLAGTEPESATDFGAHGQRSSSLCSCVQKSGCIAPVFATWKIRATGIVAATGATLGGVHPRWA
ncbi:Endoglucanase 3 [Hordeum vulgare]|nr:Endoglucanase 3 [Hordeum vulgare]